MKNISALIVAHNEENNLPLCLASLNNIDEIVLILDKTTDNSRDIAKKYNIFTLGINANFPILFINFSLLNSS